MVVKYLAPVFFILSHVLILHAPPPPPQGKAELPWYQHAKKPQLSPSEGGTLSN